MYATIAKKLLWRGVFLAVMLAVPGPSLMDSPMAYTLTDLGKYYDKGVGYDNGDGVMFTDSGQVAVRPNPELDRLRNGVPPGLRGDSIAYTDLGGGQYIRYTSPLNGGRTNAFNGSPEFFVGSVQARPAESGPDVAAFYSPQTGWVMLAGIAANGSHAVAFNSSRQIVGGAAFDQQNHILHAFITKDDTTIDLNQFVPSTADLVLLSATDIDDQGRIIGVAGTRENLLDYHIFELTPVLEPSTLAVFGLASAGFLVYRKRRG